MTYFPEFGDFDETRTQHSSAASSSRTYSLSEPCPVEDTISPGGESNTTRPTPDNKDNSTFNNNTNEMMMCPRCARSFCKFQMYKYYSQLSTNVHISILFFMVVVFLCDTTTTYYIINSASSDIQYPKSVA
jgi:hypothetical protein